MRDAKRNVTLRALKQTLAALDVRVAVAPPKVADPYYSSPEHRAWRSAVIARAGGRCQGAECQAPERRGHRLFADHVRELRDGGSATDLANGVALCGACHSRKTARVRRERQVTPAGAR